MSRLSELARTPQPTVLRCSLGAALRDMRERDPESHLDLQRWLTGDYVPGDTADLGSDGDVYRILQAEGYRIGKQQIGIHRRGDCGCLGKR